MLDKMKIKRLLSNLTVFYNYKVVDIKLENFGNTLMNDVQERV